MCVCVGAQERELDKQIPNQNKPDLGAPSTSEGIHPASGDQVPLVSCDQPENKKIKRNSKI